MGAYSGASVIDRIEAGFIQLSQDVNTTSVAARNAWIIFIAVIAYFFINLAAVSHTDLLLSRPVKLPILDVDIGQQAFFLFGPVALVLMHFSLLLQHAMLARKVRNLHERIAHFEGTDLYRKHGVRLLLNSYFYTQLIAGPFRSKFFSTLLRLTGWLTMAVLPVLVLLGFQVTYLPNHDLVVTWAHRIYIVVDIFIMIVFGVFMRFPEAGFVSGFGRNMAIAPIVFGLLFLAGTSAVFFSICVATIPDERMDRAMTSVWPMAVYKNEGDQRRPRYAFGLTTLLFEGQVDYLTGKLTSTFGRNLVVTDVTLVTGDAKLTTISLRKRDLRYGVFDRTDLHNADMTGVLATGASFRETNLNGAKLRQVDIQQADFWRAQIISVDARNSVLRNSIFREADMSQMDVRNSILDGSDLREAMLGSVHWNSASVKNADMRGAANFFRENLTEEQYQGTQF